jgi:hypothetical protein
MIIVKFEFLDIHGDGLLESSVNTKQIVTFRFLPQEASRAMTHAAQWRRQNFSLGGTSLH